MNRLRLAVQIIFTILTNGYAFGFINGKIYQGKSKYICVPGLNCYSCPGAVASCPIGSWDLSLFLEAYWGGLCAGGSAPLEWSRIFCIRSLFSGKEKGCPIILC